MSRKLYPTDLTEQQWHVIESLVPPSKAGDRPRTVDMQSLPPSSTFLPVVVQPRLLPPDLPLWPIVYYYFRCWRITGLWQQMNQTLRQKVRSSQGRETTPRKSDCG